MTRFGMQQPFGPRTATIALISALTITVSPGAMVAADRSPDGRAMETLRREAEERRERAREREQEREQMRRQRELEERRQRELQERQQQQRQEAMQREHQQREAMAAQAARERALQDRLALQRERLERERRENDRLRNADRDRIAPVVPFVPQPAPAPRPIAARPVKPAKAVAAKAVEVVPEPLSEAELAAALKDLDSGDHKRIAEALGKLGKAQAAGDRALVAGKIVEHLDRAHPLERRLASRALEVWATEKELPQLLELLTDDAREVRLSAIHALGELKDPRAIVPLADRLVSADDRNAAAKALSQFDAAAEPAILKHLNHDDLWVRTTTISLLSIVGGEASIDALKALAAQDESELVRSKARSALRAVESRSSS